MYLQDSIHSTAENVAVQPTVSPTAVASTPVQSTTKIQAAPKTAVVVKKTTSQVTNDSSYLSPNQALTTNFLHRNTYFYSKEYKNLPVFKTSSNNQETVIIQPILRNDSTKQSFILLKDVSLLVIILVISIYAWIRVYYGKFLNQLFLSSINHHETERLYRSNNALMNRMYYILNLISFIVIGFFISIYLRFHQLNILHINKDFVMLIAPIFVMGYYIYKTSVSKFLGFLFQRRNMFDEVLHATLIYTKVFSIILIGAVALIFYVQEWVRVFFLYAPFVLFIIVFILSTYRVIRIFISKGFTFFYTMLYLCIVEILPLLLAYKLITRQ